MLGKSIVLTLHTAGQDEPAGVRARGRLAYWAYSHVDLFMAVSPPLADRLEDAGFSASRVCRGTNGLDMARFHPAEPGERIRLRRTLGLPESGALILFVGFFSLDKGAHVLFEAWRRIANGVGAGRRYRARPWPPPPGVSIRSRWPGSRRPIALAGS